MFGPVYLLASCSPGDGCFGHVAFELARARPHCCRDGEEHDPVRALELERSLLDQLCTYDELDLEVLAGDGTRP